MLMFFPRKMKRIVLFPTLIVLLSGIQAKKDRGLKVTHEITWDPRFTYELGFGRIHRLEVHIDEYMDISCPQYDADASSTLKFIIYNVSKQSFDHCVATADAKKIFNCNQPGRPKKLTTKFQKRSPNPLGFVFRPGFTYYYLAVVSNHDASPDVVDDEQQFQGSPCDDVMRMAIHVKPKFVHSHTTTTRSRKPTTKITTTTTTTTTTKQTSTSTSTSASTKKIQPSSTSMKKITTTMKKPPVVATPLEQKDDGGGSSRLHHSLSLLLFFLALSWILQQ